jgi:transcription initiation factor TFIIB
MSNWDMYDQLKSEFIENDIINESVECTNIDNISNISNDVSNISNKDDDTYCMDCGQNSITEDTDAMVCILCGRDYGQIIDRSNECRWYGVNDSKHASDPTRCGIPINQLLPKSSLGTSISGRGYENFRRLQQWNSISYQERKLLKQFNLLVGNVNDNETDISNNVLDTTKTLYKMLNDECPRSQQGLMAACLFYSCKGKNTSRSTKEIADIFNLKVKKTTKSCKQFQEIAYRKGIKCNNMIKPTTPYNFIERYSSKLGISKEYKIIAMYVSYIADKLGIVSENTPPSISVGSIYLISDEYNLGLSKIHIANMCDTSEVTISKTYKKLKSYSTYLFPTEDKLLIFVKSHPELYK